MAPHTEHIREILENISGGGAVSQRALARRLGIALGLTNQLLRVLAARGMVSAVRDRGNRVTYELTEAGVEEQGRMSREALTQALATYSSVRARIRDRLVRLAEDSRPDCVRVVFYGWSDAAEIATACAPDAGVRLVGIVDEPSAPARTPSGVAVCPPHQLTALSFAGEPFDRVLVTALADVAGIRQHLTSIGLAPERVSWL